MDNTQIAALAAENAKIGRAHPYVMQKTVPPINPPADANGVLITLDCEVLINRAGRLGLPTRRAKVVGIGDGSLPGRVIIRVRPHGSNYVEGAQPEGCEVHVFDELAWLAAEEAAAHVMAHQGTDLAKCLWGGFYFDQFKREAAKAYVAALPDFHITERRA